MSLGSAQDSGTGENWCQSAWAQTFSILYFPFSFFIFDYSIHLSHDAGKTGQFYALCFFGKNLGTSAQYLSYSCPNRSRSSLSSKRTTP